MGCIEMKKRNSIFTKSIAIVWQPKSLYGPWAKMLAKISWLSSAKLHMVELAEFNNLADGVLRRVNKDSDSFRVGASSCKDVACVYRRLLTSGRSKNHPQKVSAHFGGCGCIFRLLQAANLYEHARLTLRQL